MSVHPHAWWVVTGATHGPVSRDSLAARRSIGGCRGLAVVGDAGPCPPAAEAAGSKPTSPARTGLGLLQNGWNRTQEPKPSAALPGSLEQALESVRSSENCLFFPESRWFWLHCPRGAWARAPATLRWKRVCSQLKIPRAEDGAWRWARCPVPTREKPPSPRCPEHEPSQLGRGSSAQGPGLGGGSTTPPQPRSKPKPLTVRTPLALTLPSEQRRDKHE